MESKDLLFKSIQPIMEHHRNNCGEDWNHCDCQTKYDEAFDEAMRIVTNNSTAITAHVPGWTPPEEAN